MEPKDETSATAPLDSTRKTPIDRPELEQTVRLSRAVAGAGLTRPAKTRARLEAAEEPTVSVSPGGPSVVTELPTRLQHSAPGLSSSSDGATRVVPPPARGDAALVSAVPPAVDSDVRPVTAPANKRILKQRFELLRMLGAGGMGNVYLAKDLLREEMEDSDPLVAIKVLNDECRNMPGALQSLQREAKKAQALSHPNIVTVFDFDRDGETAFITMEYIEGEELKRRLRRVRRLPHQRAMQVIERVARGLAYAHQQGFAHSDIKPANIFLGEDGGVRILDFGIAKAFAEAKKEKRSAADDLTEGALTPAYASLEMLQGASPIAADDVYSLACMAYEMISGRHPFIGADGLPLPADVAQQRGAKVEAIPGIPARHMKALRKALQFERARRFNDAGEFIDAIKPRNWRRDVALLTAAVVFAGAGFLALDFGLQQVVPSVDSLQPALAEVAELIVEADELLALNDVSSANRLYAQAWDEANYLTAADNLEREKVHAILRDRMNQLSTTLIDLSRQKGIGEYQLRELYVALEFLLRGEQTDNAKNIEKALAAIEQRIERLGKAAGQ